MRYPLRFCLSLGLLLAQLACDSAIEDLKSEAVSSSVAVTESADGVVTGVVDPKQDAKIVASKNSELSDSSIMIPSGALQINADAVSVDVGPAVDQTPDVALALGISSQKIGEGTASLFAGGSAAPLSLNPGQTLQISMPLPISTESLGLHSGGHLVLLYVYYTGSGYKAGLKVLDPSELRGIFVETTAPGLGFFRVVYLPEHIEAKEVDVSFTPGLKRSTGK